MLLPIELFPKIAFVSNESARNLIDSDLEMVNNFIGVQTENDVEEGYKKK